MRLTYSKIIGSGVFSEPGASPSTNHAIDLVGWDDTRGAWLLRNSWGLAWGRRRVRLGKVTEATVSGSSLLGFLLHKGDGGTLTLARIAGIFYTREPWIRNSSGETLNVKVQYVGWTGTDGMKWLRKRGLG